MDPIQAEKGGYKHFMLKGNLGAAARHYRHHAGPRFADSGKVFSAR